MATGAPTPSPAERDEATTNLVHWANGSTSARDRLFRCVESDLRALAAGFLRGERPGHTLQPTALVNEAYLRLIVPDGLEVKTRGQFMGLAARAMRQILVEHARAKNRDKRGGGWMRIDGIEDLAENARGEEVDLLALDRALERLKKRSEGLARLIELRFFAGLSREESAEALGVSSATFGREWRAAKALIAKYLEEDRAG